MTRYEPHEQGCSCCTLPDTTTDYRDVWAGNPDTDKYWHKEERR